MRDLLQLLLHFPVRNNLLFLFLGLNCYLCPLVLVEATLHLNVSLLKEKRERQQNLLKLKDKKCNGNLLLLCLCVLCLLSENIQKEMEHLRCKEL